MTRAEIENKLTDYAFGELPPAERAEIERALEGDANLRAQLDAIRETVALVGACPKAGAGVKEERLATERVDAILSRIVTGPVKRRDWSWLGPVSVAAAAVLAVMVYLGDLGTSQREKDLRWKLSSVESREAAMNERLALAARQETLRKSYEKLAAEQQTLSSLSLVDLKRNEVLNRLLALRTELGELQKQSSELDVLTAKVESDIFGYVQSGNVAEDQRAHVLGADILGESGLFTRDHFDAGIGYDLRVRSVYPLITNIPDFPLGTRLQNRGGIGLTFRALKRAGLELKTGGQADLLTDSFIDFVENSERSTEEYNPLIDNPFTRPFDAPLSTFSIDVDTASYANVRRILTDGQLPPPDAVRLEELVNYFHYGYTAPGGADPFSVALEAHAAPWEPKHQLVRIGLQGKEISVKDAPPAHLVFLVDVSGSMSSEDKLPLVQKSLHLLTARLRAEDSISLVVYAGNSGLVLPPTQGTRQEEINKAIDNLSAGGSTNGGEGIQLAYKIATENFIKDGVNRVILCTDGDFNVGVTSEGDLDRLIEEKRKTGVFLSVLGFGRGNLADARMQALADKGNGNASYIDSLKEAQKVLVEQATGTLITIAKDVKIQVEFNPAKVAAYRLIGYENRLLAAQDFNDDRKDAGEIGAGHQVTALYEVIPAGQEVPVVDVDRLKYQETAKVIAQGDAAAELCTVKLRFKAPDGDASRKIEFALADPGLNPVASSTDFEFAASVAAFAMCLRDSEYKGKANLALVRELATAGLGDDAKGYRAEFVQLVKKAEELVAARKKAAEEKK